MTGPKIRLVENEPEEPQKTPRALMLADLARSGFTEADAKRLGFAALSVEQTLALEKEMHPVGWGKSAGRCSYPIPYFNADRTPHLDKGAHFSRLKYLCINKEQEQEANEKKWRKYDQAIESQTPLYFPRLSDLDYPTVLRDQAIPLWIVEGEKKAEALAKLGIAAVGIGGVWMAFVGKDKAGNRQTLVPGLRDGNYKGREIVWCPDYDPEWKDRARKNVELASQRMRAVFTELGVSRFLHLTLPPGDRGEKQGLDDFLVVHGRAALDKLVEVQREAPQLHSIRYRPGNVGGMLRELEDLMSAAGVLYQMGGMYVIPREADLPGALHYKHKKDAKLPPPRQLLTAPLNLTDLRIAGEKVACLLRAGSDKPKLEPLPDKLIFQLNEMSDKHARTISGLVQHPIFTPEGRLIDTEGYDETGLYLSFGGWNFPPIAAEPTKDDAKRAADRLRHLLLPDVLLKDKALDGGALLALFLTGVGRKVLDKAPAGLINATVQGTGKTTLAQILYVVLTGRDMAVHIASTDPAEQEKALLSVLLRQPTIVVYDNLEENSTIQNAGLAAAVTARDLNKRILGSSKDVTVPTNSLFVFTGNHITVVPDMIRRIIKVDLYSKKPNPEGRKFKHPDIAVYARSIRVEAITCALTIQRAWHVARRPQLTKGESFGMGSEFDALVTQPLAFVGEQRGLFEKKETLRTESPQEQSRTSILHALGDVFGAGPDALWFSSADCVDAACSIRELHQALDETDKWYATNPKRLGGFLTGMLDQPPRDGYELKTRFMRRGKEYIVIGTPAKAPDLRVRPVKGQK